MKPSQMPDLRSSKQTNRITQYFKLKPEIFEKLKQRAKNEHRSIPQQVELIIEEFFKGE